MRGAVGDLCRHCALERVFSYSSAATTMVIELATFTYGEWLAMASVGVGVGVRCASAGGLQK